MIRELVSVACYAVFAGGGVLAVWSIQRDVRAAWPRIVALFTEEETSDDDDT